MPSRNAKQHRLMAMAAHDPEAAKRVGVPQDVAEEFVQADNGKTFKTETMANAFRKRAAKGK